MLRRTASASALASATDAAPARRTGARPRLRPGAVIATAMAALVLVLGAQVPALAHDRLLSSDPADGAVLETAPQAITLTFSDTPLDVSPKVRVTGGDGVVLAEGAPQIQGTSAVLALPNGLPAGRATVQWRVVSADGHPIEGELAFNVKQGSAAAPSGDASAGATSAPAAVTSAPPSSQPASPSASATAAESAGDGTGIDPVLLIGGLAALVVGAVITFAVIGRRRPR